MVIEHSKERRTLEVMLIVLMLGMTTLFYRMGEHRLVTLNLFFLLIVLSGYYLGRTSAGVMALCCALFVTIVTMLQPAGLVAYSSPLLTGLTLTIWAAVLGLTAILVGTLCDERARTVNELHRAYVGVVDVLSKYLQSANPEAKARSVRIAELSQTVAQEMKLSRKEIDDVRVAALLHDLGSVEVTTQLISKAVSTLETNPAATGKYTFLGTDLVQSLGSVLEGALPLLVSQEDSAGDCLPAGEESSHARAPRGARIISVARDYDALTTGNVAQPSLTPDNALKDLRKEHGVGYDDVLDAIERVAQKSTGATLLEPAYN